MYWTAMRLVVRVVDPSSLTEQPAFLAVACVAAVLSVGCGQGNSPTAPTGTLGDASVAVAEKRDVSTIATWNPEFGTALKVNGKGNQGNKGKGGDDSNEADNVNGSVNDGAHGRRGMLSGFVTDVGDDWIEIRGIRVNISEDTIIRHGHWILEIDDIHEGDHAQARGTMNDSALEATEIKVEDTGKDNDDEDEGEQQDED